MHRQAFHKSKIISSKCMPCTDNPFTRPKIFQASVCHEQATLSQGQNYFKQVNAMNRQRFHKSKIISSKCMPCTGKPFTRPKLFKASVWHAQATLSQGQNYFKQVYAMNRQPFHKAKNILSKCMTCTDKHFTSRKVFQASVCHAQATLSQGQNYFKQVYAMNRQPFHKSKII